MLKALTPPGPHGRPALILGLSATNVDRLRSGQPIHVDGGELGLEVDVLIFGGRGDETDLRAVLAEHFDVGEEADRA